MPKLTIDNREIEVSTGTKVIEAAEQLGIMIPRFCYHPALGSVGACRVCAVAFTDGPVKGIQMSCMVNAQDGMLVSTTDAEAVDFRRHVIEWLMLNHPHDCPVCDEGGHCLLQDLTVSGGHGMRRYKGLKRTHHDQYLGPLIQHEMNRCIQCYRCARYYQEFAGAKDLGVMGIGSRVYFGRSKPGTLKSPFSGNLIDICPTGVYTDKPSRFIGRRWDFQRSQTVCLHCSLGCNLVASVRYRRVVRHEARPNADVNGYFICDRGRYGYAYNDSADRPRHALVKGVRKDMTDAISSAGRAFANVIEKYGPQCVAAVGSVRSSLETLAVLDHLCREHQWRGPVTIPENRKAQNLKTAVGSLDIETAVSLGAVSVAEQVLVIGADPVNEAPMLVLSLRQAQRQGGHVAVIDPRAIEMPLDFDHLPVAPADLGAALQHLIRGAARTADSSSIVTDKMAGDGRGDRLGALAVDLLRRRQVVIVCGTDITTAEEIGLAAELVRVLRRVGIEAKLFYSFEGPNAFGAGRLARDDQGIEGILGQIEDGRIKALLVVENDVWRGYPDRRRLTAALSQLELLIILDHMASPLVEKADFFLPTQTLYEAGGLWINNEGRIQSAEPVLAGGASIAVMGKGSHPPRVYEDEIPESAPRAARDLLQALVSGAGDEKAAHNSDILAVAMDRARALLGALPDGGRVDLGKGGTVPSFSTEEPTFGPDAVPSKGITVLVVDWTFGTDGLSSNSSVLAQVTPQPVATMHPKTADRLSLGPEGRMTVTTEAGQILLAWQSDSRMALDVIVMPRHHLLEWQVLGATRLELNVDQIRTEKR